MRANLYMPDKYLTELSMVKLQLKGNSHTKFLCAIITLRPLIKPYATLNVEVQSSMKQLSSLLLIVVGTAGLITHHVT